ncbi:hypothetical protein MF271_16690 [Deinococcus sp. KNUC1210]|uniref:hypothetical protein n=1 Tax=Deinococcus sp. KNUC1210 TaxID=2917691 RepID=UPI001EEFB092|nr:hypothetical protein [Deinococcus sp. KNUC1210]ULH15526.1 hypothetical protein MF271_16690 [Deinococcus sp. KNUC1210]
MTLIIDLEVTSRPQQSADDRREGFMEQDTDGQGRESLLRMTISAMGMTTEQLRHWLETILDRERASIASTGRAFIVDVPEDLETLATLLQLTDTPLTALPEPLRSDPNLLAELAQQAQALRR